MVISVSGICDAERSSQDDIFASQTRFRTPDEQEHEVHDDIDALLQGEQLESTTPTERNLTPAQKNLIKDLAKHKVTILKHQGMANHFRHLSQSGTIFPDYTQPALHLRDYKTFSSDSKSRLNTITKTFQRSVLELLSAHHDEVAANTKLLVDSRNDSITSMYDKHTCDFLNNLARDYSHDLYSTNLAYRKPTGRGNKRPRQ